MSCRLSKFWWWNQVSPTWRWATEAACLNLVVAGRRGQASGLHDSWAAAWDPQVWPIEHADGVDRAHQNAGTVHDVLPPDSAIVPTLQCDAADADVVVVSSNDSTAPLTQAAAPQVPPMEFVDAPAQTDICFFILQTRTRNTQNTKVLLQRLADRFARW